MNLSNSYYKGTTKLDDWSPSQPAGTRIYVWNFPYPISYPNFMVEADANIQWQNGQPKKFNLFFDGKGRTYLYASLLTTDIAEKQEIVVKVFSIGY